MFDKRATLKLFQLSPLTYSSFYFLFFLSALIFQLARSYSLITSYQSSILCTSWWKQLSDNFSSLIYFFHNLIHLKENIKWVGEMIKVFEGLYFPLYLLVSLLFVCLQYSLHSRNIEEVHISPLTCSSFYFLFYFISFNFPIS